MRGLADHHVAIDDIGRREGADAFEIVHMLNQRVGALFARHVGIVDVEAFAEQPHELAASGDFGPVPEFDAHASTSPGA